MKISEKFYSIQAEGASIGVPAYFIRLPGCNLMCGGADGELMKKCEATWWCDSEILWKQSKEVSYDELITEWAKENILDDIISGSIHLVWTGGEPATPKNVECITSFLSTFRTNASDFLYNVFNELETNGTIETPEGHNRTSFYDMFQQINCSPKLSNSGIPDARRRVAPAIDQIKRNSNHWFKFVVSNEADVLEAFNTYVVPFNIDRNRIILMPGCDSQKEIIERTAFAFEMAKKYRVRAVTRAQILVWDKKSGV